MKSKIYTGLLLVAILAMTPEKAMTAATTIGSSAAIGPVIAFTLPVALNFGELTVPDSSIAGSIAIDAASGAATLVNAFQIGTAARGSITITGRKTTNISFVMTQAGFVCDNTYLTGACTGDGSLVLTLTNTFGTQIDVFTPACPTGIRCSEQVNIGGTFAFPAGAEGRWTNDITITANYQ